MLNYVKNITNPMNKKQTDMKFKTKRRKIVGKDRETKEKDTYISYTLHLHISRFLQVCANLQEQEDKNVFKT